MRPIALAAAFLLVAALAILEAQRAQAERAVWVRYRDTHRCQAISQQRPPAGISTTPGQTVWQCDAGETFVKDSE